MTAFVFVLVLTAAVLHASWNALVKSAGESLVAMGLVYGTGGLLAIPFLFSLPLPDVDSWPYLIATAILHVIYGVALARMLDSGELSRTYPIARGSAPIMIFLLAAIFADEWPTATSMAAIALISGGIISLSFFGRMADRWTTTFRALFVGLIISLYSYTDGQGVRLSGHSLSYIAWMFFLIAVVFVPATVILRRQTILVSLSTVWKTGLIGGVFSTIAYGIVIWAMGVAPMAHVAALRETSVVFAVLIGTRILGEDGGHWRVASAAVVFLGVVALLLSVGDAG